MLALNRGMSACDIFSADRGLYRSHGAAILQAARHLDPARLGDDQCTDHLGIELDHRENTMGA